MAMPFIFGNHRCPFDFLRFMMRPRANFRGFTSPKWFLNPRRILCESRMSEGAVYGPQLSEDDESRKKTRGRRINRKIS